LSLVVRRRVAVMGLGAGVLLLALLRLQRPEGTWIAARGRVFRFSVLLPDKPGQLLNVSRILAEENANVINLDHDQTQVTDSFQKVVLTVTVETHDHDHIDRIITALHKNGYQLNIIY